MPERSYGSRNRDGTINNALIVPRHGEIAATPPPAIVPRPVPRTSDTPYHPLQERTPAGREYSRDSIFSDRVR